MVEKKQKGGLARPILMSAAGSIGGQVLKGLGKKSLGEEEEIIEEEHEE